uniref:mRNA interferase MazF n=1 Tax=Candidatus Kentrum sp. TC TaxID=2126339 RepID=A0A450YFL2_9GAMM|nr:MAG: mRNA interferase MazF [Candidatus Kentron sp. TC]
MMNLAIGRGDVWWIGLDPTQGSEIGKTRPCIVLTHDTLNDFRRTVVVVPLSTVATPITVSVMCRGKPAIAVVDRIRAVAKHRLQSRVETLAPNDLDEVCWSVSTILDLR